MILVNQTNSANLEICIRRVILEHYCYVSEITMALTGSSDEVVLTRVKQVDDGIIRDFMGLPCLHLANWLLEYWSELFFEKCEDFVLSFREIGDGFVWPPISLIVKEKEIVVNFEPVDQSEQASRYFSSFVFCEGERSAVVDKSEFKKSMTSFIRHVSSFVNPNSRSFDVKEFMYKLSCMERATTLDSLRSSDDVSEIFLEDFCKECSWPIDFIDSFKRIVKPGEAAREYVDGNLPNQSVIDDSGLFLKAIQENNWPKPYVACSPVGGICFTFRCNSKEVCIMEILNHVSDEDESEAATKPVSLISTKAEKTIYLDKLPMTVAELDEFKQYVLD